MERVCDELDEAKAEIERLRAEHKTKVELSESLKRAHNDLLIKIQEANARIQKQAQELNEKVDEISATKQMYEELKSSLNEKEALIKHLSSANDKLRANCDEKIKKLEEENRKLVVALDETNSKNTDQEQKLHAYEDEVKGLKSLLSASEKKCLEAEKKAKESKEMRQRDDMLLKLEEENRKVEDQLKWKKEQFKHLEEAHDKLRGQYKVSKKEWEMEKSTLLDEISTLQTNLDSQTRISEALQNQLQMCNQALAHEESRRKCLEVQLSETKTSFDNIFSECEEAKSKIECLVVERDKNIASLRDLLGTKEMLHKEMEYQVGRLKQENQELRLSVKELQEATIQEAGTSSSLSKIRNKLKGLEQIHKDCSKKLQAKEAEWASEMEKMAQDLTQCRSKLDSKDRIIKELKMDLESCHSLNMNFELQNEETSLMLLMLKSEILEARLKLADETTETNMQNNEREEKISLLTKQLEMMSAALVKAQTNIEENHEKLASLSSEVESSGLVENQKFQLQDELERHKEMLEESSGYQIHLKERNLQMESDLKRVHEALDRANDELDRNFCEENELELELHIWKSMAGQLKANLEENQKKMASLSGKDELFSLIEQQKPELQVELERHREMFRESSGCQICLKEQALHMESDLEKVHEALDRANNELAEKFCKGNEVEVELQIWKSIAGQLKANLEENHEKMASLLSKVESLSLVENQKLQLQDELERHKEMLKESSRNQLHLKEQALQMEIDLKRDHDALNAANDELAEKFCEGNELEFELQLWKSVAERLQSNLEGNLQMRKLVEASLLAEIEFEVTLRQEKESLGHLLEEKDRRIDDLQRQLVSLDQTLKIRETESASPSSTETSSPYELKEEREEEIAAELDLQTSASTIHKLESEKRNLLKDVEKLLSDREHLLGFIGRLSKRMNSFCAEDAQLMGVWERIVQNFDKNLEGDDELFDPLKENMNIQSTFTTKSVEAAVDDRSPLRSLNN